MIRLKVTECDDHDFVDIVVHFIVYFTQQCHPTAILVSHVDNWFGDRWLGFAGKTMGALGVRSRTVNDCRLPVPPFKPTRILSVVEVQGSGKHHPVLHTIPTSALHKDKSGSDVRYLTRSGLYVWYSGNTKANTAASMMVYDVTSEGSSGWYIGFECKHRWSPICARNIPLQECQDIASGMLNT